MNESQIHDDDQDDEGAIVDESVSPEYAGTDLRPKRKPLESKPGDQTVRHQPSATGSFVEDVERGAVEEIEEAADGTPTEGGPLVQPNPMDTQDR